MDRPVIVVVAAHRRLHTAMRLLIGNRNMLQATEVVDGRRTGLATRRWSSVEAKITTAPRPSAIRTTDDRLFAGWLDVVGRSVGRSVAMNVVSTPSSFVVVHWPRRSTNQNERQTDRPIDTADTLLNITTAMTATRWLFRVRCSDGSHRPFDDHCDYLCNSLRIICCPIHINTDDHTKNC